MLLSTHPSPLTCALPPSQFSPGDTPPVRASWTARSATPPSHGSRAGQPQTRLSRSNLIAAAPEGRGRQRRCPYGERRTSAPTQSEATSLLVLLSHDSLGRACAGVDAHLSSTVAEGLSAHISETTMQFREATH